MIVSLLVVSTHCILGTQVDFDKAYSANLKSLDDKKFVMTTIRSKEKKSITVSSSPLTLLIMESESTVTLTASEFALVQVQPQIDVTINVHGPIFLAIDKGTEVKINAYIKNNIVPIIIYDNGINVELTLINDGGNSAMTSLGQYGFNGYILDGVNIYQNPSATYGYVCGYQDVRPDFSALKISDIKFYDFTFSMTSTEIITIIVVVTVLLIIGIVIAILFCIPCCCPSCCPCLACLLCCKKKDSNEEKTNNNSLPI